jgi:hypothetical protein
VSITFDELEALPEGESISLGDRTYVRRGDTLQWRSFRVPLEEFRTQVDQITPGVAGPQIGQWRESGTSRYFLAAATGELSVYYIGWRLREGVWEWTGDGTVLLEATFNPLPQCEPDEPEWVRTTNQRLLRKWQEKVGFEEQITRLNAENHTLRTRSVETPVPVQAAVDLSSLQDDLCEWMSDHGEEQNTALRDLMSDHGMTPPSYEEEIDVSFTVNGTIDVDVEAPDFSLSLEADRSYVSHSWSVDLSTTITAEDGTCVCDQVDSELVADLMRQNGHGDVLDAAEDWTLDNLNCENG